MVLALVIIMDFQHLSDAWGCMCLWPHNICVFLAYWSTLIWCLPILSVFLYILELICSFCHCPGIVHVLCNWCNLVVVNYILKGTIIIFIWIQAHTASFCFLRKSLPSPLQSTTYIVYFEMVWNRKQPYFLSELFFGLPLYIATEIVYKVNFWPTYFVILFQQDEGWKAPR